MSNQFEKQARGIVDGWDLSLGFVNDAIANILRADIHQALRDTHNAALEEAAKIAEESKYAPELIRALKVKP